MFDDPASSKNCTTAAMCTYMAMLIILQEKNNNASYLYLNSSCPVAVEVCEVESSEEDDEGASVTPVNPGDRGGQEQIHLQNCEIDCNFELSCEEDLKTCKAESSSQQVEDFCPDELRDCDILITNQQLATPQQAGVCGESVVTSDWEMDDIERDSDPGELNFDLHCGKEVECENDLPHDAHLKCDEETITSKNLSLWSPETWDFICCHVLSKGRGSSSILFPQLFQKIVHICLLFTCMGVVQGGTNTTTPESIGVTKPPANETDLLYEVMVDHLEMCPLGSVSIVSGWWTPFVIAFALLVGVLFALWLFCHQVKARRATVKEVCGHRGNQGSKYPSHTDTSLLQDFDDMPLPQKFQLCLHDEQGSSSEGDGVVAPLASVTDEVRTEAPSLAPDSDSMATVSGTNSPVEVTTSLPVTPVHTVLDTSVSISVVEDDLTYPSNFTPPAPFQLVNGSVAVPSESVFFVEQNVRKALTQHETQSIIIVQQGKVLKRLHSQEKERDLEAEELVGTSGHHVTEVELSAVEETFLENSLILPPLSTEDDNNRLFHSQEQEQAAPFERKECHVTLEGNSAFVGLQMHRQYFPLPSNAVLSSPVSLAMNISKQALPESHVLEFGLHSGENLPFFQCLVEPKLIADPLDFTDTGDSTHDVNTNADTADSTDMVIANVGSTEVAFEASEFLNNGAGVVKEYPCAMDHQDLRVKPFIAILPSK